MDLPQLWLIRYQVLSEEDLCKFSELVPSFDEMVPHFAHLTDTLQSGLEGQTKTQRWLDLRDNSTDFQI